MANGLDSGVQYVDSTASFTGPLAIRGIKYVGNTSGSVVITNATSAKRLWEQNGATDVFDDVEIHVNESTGITVTVSNSAKVYLYYTR